MQADGIIHLKTDSSQLYQFTKTVINFYQLQLLHDSHDVYSNDDIDEALKIKTHYEKLDIAQSNKVHYLAFRLNNELPKEKDAQLKELIHEQTGG